MKIILRHLSQYNMKQIKIFYGDLQPITNLYSTFIKILEETFNSIEYYVCFGNKGIIGMINQSNIEKYAKSNYLDTICDINNNILLKNEIIEGLINIKEFESKNKIDTTIKSISINSNNNDSDSNDSDSNNNSDSNTTIVKDNDYIEIIYFLYWNEECNCIEYFIKMTINSREYFENLMNEHKIAEELIGRFLYEKNHFKTVKAII